MDQLVKIYVTLSNETHPYKFYGGYTRAITRAARFAQKHNFTVKYAHVYDMTGAYRGNLTLKEMHQALAS